MQETWLLTVTHRVTAWGLSPGQFRCSVAQTIVSPWLSASSMHAVSHSSALPWCLQLQLCAGQCDMVTGILLPSAVPDTVATAQATAEHWQCGRSGQDMLAV